MILLVLRHASQGPHLVSHIYGVDRDNYPDSSANTPVNGRHAGIRFDPSMCCWGPSVGASAGQEVCS